MSANLEIISKLPEKFTRKELLKIVVKDYGYSISKVSSVLEQGIVIGVIERTGKGEYKKAEIGSFEH